VSLGLTAHLTARFLMSFRDGLLAGETHVASLRRALGDCGPSHWRFALVTCGIALALRTADIAAVRTFGGLLAGMTAATLFSTLVFLPALLAGRIGRWLQAATPAAAPTTSLPEVLPSPHVRFEPVPRDVVRPAV
jgi:hypothetical protein